MTLDTSRALLQVRIDPQLAIRLASQRYDIPNNSCYCINPNNYNYDQYNRFVDGRTQLRRQGGGCSSLDPFHNVDSIIQRESFLIRPQIYRSGFSSLGAYDTQAIGRGSAFKYGNACQAAATSVGGGYGYGASGYGASSYGASGYGASGYSANMNCADMSAYSQDAQSAYSQELPGYSQGYAYESGDMSASTFEVEGGSVDGY